MENEGRVTKFYNENKDRFLTKRQASKYLNHYGRVWKCEHKIPLSDPKRKANTIWIDPKSCSYCYDKAKEGQPNQRDYIKLYCNEVSA